MSKSKIVKSSIFVMILVILGKFLGIARDSLMLAKFGATREADIYVWALGVIYLFTSIGYGLSTTIIPFITEMNSENELKERKVFVNNVLTVSMIFTLAITILGVIFSDQIVYYFANSFTVNRELSILTSKILRIMFLSVLFLTLQGVLAGTLQGHQHFIAPTAMAAVANLVYIIYLVFFVDSFGVIGFAIATVIAFMSQYLINVPKFMSLGYKYRFTIDLKDEKLRKLLVLMIPIIISTSSIQLNLFVNKSFATSLYEGATAILECANKLTMMTYEVFAVVVSMIIYPILASHISERNNKKFKEALNKGIAIILLIMIPATIGIIVLREPLISLIYERGKFTNENVKLAANALLLYSPAMIAYGVRDVLSRGFYSIKDTKTPMINSLIGIVLNYLFSFILYKRMGVEGLTLSASLSAIITAIILSRALSKRFEGLGMSSIIVDAIKILISSVLMGILVLFSSTYLKGIFTVTRLSDAIIILASTLIGITSYAAFCYLLRIQVFIDFLNHFKGKAKSS